MRGKSIPKNQRPRCGPSDAAAPFQKEVALLWDESFLWGLMAFKALESAHFPFDLIRSESIMNGGLEGYKVLLVPGGWASNKLKSLGEGGIDAIRRFVNRGGHYVGFCGGAGLATLDGIGLLKVKRKPTKLRVPSFSGRIVLSLSESSLWLGIHEPIFHAWWPSQFLLEDAGIKVLATYGEALPDSFSSDVNVGDTVKEGNWSELENLYRINLNPERLLNDPAVIEGSYGKGAVILSLVHFDTPNDRDGSIVLRNIWEYLGVQNGEDVSIGGEKKAGKHVMEDDTARLVSELFGRCSELISLGSRNFLWFWRNPLLLQWRRGVRGLEYCNLYAMMKEIEGMIRNRNNEADTEGVSPFSVKERLIRIKESLVPFTEKAERLLVLERKAMQSGYITYEKCDNPEIRRIRTELFSASKSYGGLFKTVIDEVDALLYTLLLHRPAHFSLKK
jgi:Biotin-protein ligase, N terminal